MERDIELIKLREKQFHEEQRDTAKMLPADVEEIRRICLSPCYTTGYDHKSDNKMAFHEFILARDNWKDKYTLDYCCGDGIWATYFALTGASRVAGFDIAESGIRRGQARADKAGLGDKLRLYTMDASSLEFPDDEFEIVIGTSVIHHVLKYPNIFEELYRVMKPGTKAFFLENLADFPLWKLHWKLKGEVPQGDVPIFAKVIREKAKMFSGVEICGDSFLFALKHFIWKPEMGVVRKQTLRALKTADNVLFRICPAMRRWGGFSYICLTK